MALAFAFLALLVTAPAGWTREVASPAASQVLARVEVPGSLTDLDLPVHADFIDAAGKYYALVIAPLTRLQMAGVSFQLIDEYFPGTRYLLALERRPGARSRAASVAKVLYDDGRQIVVREAPGLADTLADLGFALYLMSETPMLLTAPARPRLAVAIAPPNPVVRAMMAKVTQSAVNSTISGLSGETPVPVGDDAYLIATRHTNSGTPLQQATQYVFEQLQGVGLRASFQSWSSGTYANRNVIGELPGASQPEEIVMLTAHLDDMPSMAMAPGADDDASGGAGLLLAAGIMSRYRFQRTLRFVFFTGEEQGALGSLSYVDSVATEKIVAVLNLDMIAYNASPTPTQRLHIRTTGNPGYSADLAIATTFTEVVNSYGLAPSLEPIITSDGESRSDHGRFWEKGFAAVLAIEDDKNDFNPNYHTTLDKLQYLDLAYCTAQVKAAVGTIAHLAGPCPPAGPAPWTLLLLSWQKLNHVPHNFPVN